MLLRVASISDLAAGIKGFDLTSVDGTALEPFSAGSHIVLQTAAGLRQYSLCNDPCERMKYRIAVLREPNGRGGSKYLHDNVKVGDTLHMERVMNNFPLHMTARRHMLLAGGIGVTPMLSMIASLSAAGAEFHMHYCTQTPTKTAFLDALSSFVEAGRVTHYFDNGNPDNGLNMREALREAGVDTHLYYCGPSGFMAAAKAASAHWPVYNVHFEHFAAPSGTEPTHHGPGRLFRVRIASTGCEFEIPPGRTIAEVLRESGVDIQTSCEEGHCGTCMTAFLEGEPEHRDQLLDDEARSSYMLICCSRSKSDVLVLDL